MANPSQLTVQQDQSGKIVPIGQSTPTKVAVATPTPAPTPAPVPAPKSQPTFTDNKAPAPDDTSVVYSFANGEGYNAAGKLVRPATAAAGSTPAPDTKGGSTGAPSGKDATPASLGLTAPSDPNQAAIDKAQADATAGYTAGAPNADTIRTTTLKQFQDEIDALDAASAQARSDITRQYQQTGTANLGANRALLANSGMLGQVSGEASQEEVAATNTRNMNDAIATSNAKYATQKASLLTQARTMAQDEFDKKSAAYTAGANATVDYLKGKSAAAQTNADTLAKNAIAKGLDMTDPKYANDVAALAKTIGVSADTLITSYKTQKSAIDAAAAKAAKDNQTVLSPGQKIVKADGTVVASSPALDKFKDAKDAAGNPLSFDQTTGKYYGLDGKEYVPTHTAQNEGLLDAPTVNKFLSDKTDSQVAAFNKLDDIAKSDAMQLIGGDVLLSDLMSSRGVAGSAARQQILAEARAVDPTFSENVNKQRYKFKNDWNDPNSKAYLTRTSLNTALGHLSTLKGLSDQLNNGDFQKANSIGQYISSNINGPNASAVAQFQDTVNLLATEIAKAYAGGVPGQDEIDRQLSSINSMKPKDIINGVINNKVTLLGSLLNSTGQEYKQVMGDFPDSPIIHQDTLDELNKAGVDTGKITTSLIKQGMPATSVHDYITAYPDKASTAEKILRENPKLSDDELLQILQPDFSSVGADTNSGSTSTSSKTVSPTAMRTDRNNNPTAMTTAVAKDSGLVFGKDYINGDQFTGSDGKKYFTAKLLGDPVATTIKAIDQGGFTTASGNPRWSYLAKIPAAKNWGVLTMAQKKDVVKQMYQQEGGKALLSHFA